jgi:tetratricopeptide (TPR) repeat protein
VNVEEIDAQIALATVAFQAGDLEKARKVAKTLQHMKSPAGYFYEARVLSAQGRYEYAYDVVKDGLSLDRKSGRLWLEYARHCLRLGRLDECESAIGKAVEGEINPIDGGLLLAELRVAQGQPGEALTLLRGFDLSDSDINERLSVHDHLATILVQLEQYEMAMEALAAVEVTPEATPYRHARKLLWEAVVWNEGRQDPGKAMELARRAFEIDPDNPDVLADIVRIRNLSSPGVRLFRMTMAIPAAFTGVYHVAAEDPEQALNFIKELEPEKIAEKLEVLEIGEWIIEEPLPLGVLKIEVRNVGL